MRHLDLVTASCLARRRVAGVNSGGCGFGNMHRWSSRLMNTLRYAWKRCLLDNWSLVRLWSTGTYNEFLLVSRPVPVRARVRRVQIPAPL